MYKLKSEKNIMQRITLFVVCLSVFFIFSQKATSQIKLGVKAGSVYSGLTSESKYTPINVFPSIGVIGEYELNNTDWIVHAELKFTRKGGTLYAPSDNIPAAVIDKYEYKLSYLELPVSIGYSILLNTNIRLVPRFGGYFAYGISGKGIIESEQSLGKSGAIGIYSFEGNKGTLQGKDFDYRPFNRADAGLFAGCDLFYKNFFFSVDYIHGLTPMQEYSNSGKLLHRNIYFSVGAILL
ncbi:MAG TPA: hypothetical protein DEG28_10740 [Porphyromonadaceae bacterium]|nr:hypothetical protein [Porphyromonadaceae bacterium]